MLSTIGILCYLVELQTVQVSKGLTLWYFFHNDCYLEVISESWLFCSL